MLVQFNSISQTLERELDRLEEERIQLKSDNRALARQLGQKAAELALEPEDLQAVREYTDALRKRRNVMTTLSGGKEVDDGTVDIIERHEVAMAKEKEMQDAKLRLLDVEHELLEVQGKNDELMEENDSLRKGMQEILDSVRSQDATSDVKIIAPEIEKLLGVLDARHLWGNYHPAMGLKNRIEQLEGKNEGTCTTYIYLEKT